MNEIQVTVLFFAAARDATVTESTTELLAENTRLADLRTVLFTRWPQLARYGSALLWAVNNQYASSDVCLRAGDVVACFPPVSGG